MPYKLNAITGNLDLVNSSSNSAPINASYIVASGTDQATLVSSRLLVGTPNQVIVTDNGAGSTEVLSLPQSIDTNAAVRFGILAVGTSTSNNEGFHEVRVFTDPVTQVRGLLVNHSVNLTSNNSQPTFAIDAETLVNQGSSNNTSSQVSAVRGVTIISGSSGTVTNVEGITTFISNSGAGIITNARGFRIYDNTITGGGSIVNQYQLYIESPTKGSTNNYSIYSLGGNNFFGGLFSTYNNITTVSNGVPSEIAKIDTTGLTANVSAATIYAVPSSGVGMYRISSYVVETTAGSVSSTLPNVQILYTDNETGGSITIDATPILGIAGIGQTGALTSNTIGTASSGVIVINAKASTNIQYQTVNYASTAAGMAYALHIKLEVL